MTVLFRVLKDSKKHHGYIGLGILASGCATIASLYAPWAMQRLIALITSGDPDVARKSLIMGVTLLGVYILQGVFNYIKGYYTHLGAYKYVAELRLKIYDKLQHLSLRYYSDKQTGNLMSYVMNDAGGAERLFAHVFPDFVIHGLTLIAVAFMLFTINVPLALLSLASVPLIIFANYLYSKRAFPLWGKNAKVMAEMSGTLQDNLSGMKEIQAFNQQASEKERMSQAINKERDAMLQAIKMDEFVRPLIGFFSSVGLVGVIIYGGYLVSINQMAVSELVGFILYLNLFYAPINVLSSLNESTNNAIASCQRVFELLDEESEIQESSDAQTIAKLTGRIDLQDLGFAYKKEQPVLQNINLIIEPGETVALVGSTGVGKTTISNLLNRFYDPTRGRILFDGVDLKQLKLSTIRDNISMVLQDTFLFNGTVFENIVYGLKHATKEQVIQAAKAANAHDFIESLENGYDTLIGERGFKLSGGQKQRLSIARAILRDTPILIMDEATSSLDTKTEKEIQQALDKIAIDRTTIVIAHRLSTIRHADKIVVLANREIAEVGTHDELLQHAGVYAQLCQNQQI